MTPEQRKNLEDLLQHTISMNDWSEVKVQMRYVVGALRTEQDKEKLRELSFTMARIITMLMESGKRQHEELVLWIKKKLEE